MSRPVRRPGSLSLKEFLELDESSAARHEYLAGEVYALAGASKRHNTIAGNIFAALKVGAVEGSCRVYMSDVKLRARDDVVYYPDVMVACETDGGDPLIEDAPCLLVEVISPSTEAIDRREKVLVYKRIPTLLAYLIVDQAEPRVERHWRAPDGTWRHEEIAPTGDVSVPIPCPEVALPFDDIYRGVTFEEPPLSREQPAE